MKPIFKLLVCSSLLSAAVAVGPAWSAEPPKKRLSVNELAANPTALSVESRSLAELLSSRPAKALP